MKPQRDEAILSKGTQTVGGRAGKEVKLTSTQPTTTLTAETQHTHKQHKDSGQYGVKGGSALLPVRDPQRVCGQAGLLRRKGT